MNKIKVFLAAPISGFKNQLQYKETRKNLLNFIDALNENFELYSEILNIGSLDSYDEPGQSTLNDFGKISEADVFIIYHPMNMQTSTLIELGYAVAKHKKIIIIAEPVVLPYLALGLSKYSVDIKNIPCSKLNDSTVSQVKMIINSFFSCQ